MAKGIIEEVIELSGINQEEIKEKQKEWKSQQTRYTEDNADFNTTKVAKDFDEIIAHASLVSGWDQDTLKDLTEKMTINEDTVRLAQEIPADALDIVSSDFASDFYDVANDAEDVKNPYVDVPAVDKVKMLWHFTNRNIEESSSATKIAGKFSFTDEDIENLNSQDNVVKANVAVNAFRMLLDNQTAVKHVFTNKLNKSLTTVLSTAVGSLDDSVVPAEKSTNVLDGLDLKEKIRFLAFSISAVALDDKQLKQASFKVIADFSVADEDIDFIKQNSASLNTSDGSAFDIKKELPQFLDKGFSADELISNPGAFSGTVWEAVFMDAHTMGDVPASERRRIVNDVTYLLAVIKAETGFIQRPNDDVMDGIKHADKRRHGNKRESIIEQILRYEQEYLGVSDDDDDTDGPTEAELAFFYENFGEDEEDE